MTVESDNRLRALEIAITVWLSSSVAGTKAWNIWERREELAQQLREIPAELDLSEVNVEDLPRVAADIQNAIRAIYVDDVALSLATKILHKKRPLLIPIFDSRVSDHYFPKTSIRDKEVQLSRFPEMLRRFHLDLLQARSELSDLRQRMLAANCDISVVRVLEYLVWDHYDQVAALRAAN